MSQISRAYGNASAALSMVGPKAAALSQRARMLRFRSTWAMPLMVSIGVSGQAQQGANKIELSLEEKIGQMFQVRAYGDYKSFTSPDFLEVKHEIEIYHVGSLDIGARMAGPNLVKAAPDQIAAVTNEFQRDSKLPLLIGADLERGLASRVSQVPDLPLPMAFGAIGDVKAAEEAGALIAEEARAVGIQWAFAPVADINSNPQNPIINTRSFGEEPAKTGELVAAFVRGAHRGGGTLRSTILVTVKHFPGEGDTSSDPHIGQVLISADREHLTRNELLPFRAAIAARADAVMLAQAAVPAIDPEQGRVAPTSKKLVSGLLIHDLGFGGIVMTDALEMRGLREFYAKDPDPNGRIAVEAIKAGVDMLTLPPDLPAAFNAIVAAVKSGEIPESRIDESVNKILAVKAALRLNENRFVDLGHVRAIFADRAPFEFAQQVSDRAVTLIRNNGKVLPLPATPPRMSPVGPSPIGKKVIVITFTDSQRSPLGHTLDNEMMARNPNTRIFHFYNDRIGSVASAGAVLPFLTDADSIVIAAFTTHVSGRQLSINGKLVDTVGFAGASAQAFEELIAAAPGKTAVVALGSPYLIIGFPEIQNYICTYSLATTSEVSAVKALYGEIQNSAKLPVTLPGIAARGAFVPWPRAGLLSRIETGR